MATLHDTTTHALLHPLEFLLVDCFKDSFRAKLLDQESTRSMQSHEKHAPEGVLKAVRLATSLGLG